MIDKKFFSMSEIQKHDKIDDCWVVIDNCVYNVSDWIQHHPGGKTLIEQNAGKDITEKFKSAHNIYGSSFDVLENYLIGHLTHATDVNLLDQDIKNQEKKSIWQVSEEFGFLPNKKPITKLPNKYIILQDLYESIGKMLSSNRYQQYVDSRLSIIEEYYGNINEFDLESEEVLNLLHSCIGFINVAYVRGNQGVSTQKSQPKIPKILSLIWMYISDLIGRKPMIDYADLVLYNYGTHCESEDDLDNDIHNFYIQKGFSNIIDEEWFFKIHLFIEWHGRKFVSSVLNCQKIMDNELIPNGNHIYELVSHLEEIYKFQNNIAKEYFPKMYENCNPFIFFNRVRYYLKSFENVEYESFGIKNYAGPTGAQSSLFNLMDIFLGIPSPSGPLGKQVEEFGKCIPLEHQKFLKYQKQRVSLRKFIQQRAIIEDVTPLVRIYNHLVDGIYKIRVSHIKFVEDYIFANLPESVRNTMKGTGGFQNPAAQLMLRAEDCLKRKLSTQTKVNNNSFVHKNIEVRKSDRVFTNEDKQMQNQKSSSPASKLTTLTPWKVIGELDYDNIINDFKCDIIDTALLERFEKITSHKPHRFLRRNIFFSHRDLHVLLDKYERNEKFYIFTGIGPSSEMHMGHLIPFQFTKWLQDVFQVPVIIQLSDDEKFLLTKKSMNEISNYSDDIIKDIIALGFDPENTFIFSNSSYIAEMYGTILNIQNIISKNDCSTFLHLHGDDSIGKYAYAATQSAPCFSDSFPVVLKENSNLHCLIPQGIDQDPFFKITRDIVASKMDRSKPSLIHSKFLPSLLAPNSKMSSTQRSSVILLSDIPSVVQKKVNAAHVAEFSGCCRNSEIIIQNEVSLQWLQFFVESDHEFDSMSKKYLSGELSSDDIKSILVELVISLLAEHKIKRASVTKTEVKHFTSIRPLKL